MYIERHIYIICNEWMYMYLSLFCYQVVFLAVNQFIQWSLLVSYVNSRHRSSDFHFPHSPFSPCPGAWVPPPYPLPLCGHKERLRLTFPAEPVVPRGAVEHFIWGGPAHTWHPKPDDAEHGPSHPVTVSWQWPQRASGPHVAESGRRTNVTVAWHRPYVSVNGGRGDEAMFGAGPHDAKPGPWATCTKPGTAWALWWLDDTQPGPRPHD